MANFVKRLPNHEAKVSIEEHAPPASWWSRVGWIGWASPMET
jgi:hypothetical protein